MTPQPLHIFRKDILHLWPEASVVVALFIAFGIAAPSNWTNSPYAGVAQLVSLLLDLADAALMACPYLAAHP